MQGQNAAKMWQISGKKVAKRWKESGKRVAKIRQIVADFLDISNYCQFLGRVPFSPGYSEQPPKNFLLVES